MRNKVKAEDLGTLYTHYGMVYMLVPCYVAMNRQVLLKDIDIERDSIKCAMARNWVPYWWLYLWCAIHYLFCLIALLADPDFDWRPTITVTGDIKPRIKK